ncbi:MAG TPA: sulfotransferase [Sphingomicrobium sp.]|nr:sulfotransferase [Sphingomicrobium sp.]
MPLSVIGAGFGRTGTMSLKLALEQLGIGPCYHMSEVFKNPAAPGYWEAAADGKPVDWEQVFAGYRSTVDWPSATFYKELADAYPDAKVILTVRDPEAWFTSTQATIFASRIFEDATSDWGRMVLKVVGDLFDREMSNKAKLIDVYNRHNQTVQRVIPAERLLVYDLSEGWNPLCRFLGVPVPDEPIPNTNSTEDFKRRLGVEVAKHAEPN